MSTMRYISCFLTGTDLQSKSCHKIEALFPRYLNSNTSNHNTPLPQWRNHVKVITPWWNLCRESNHIWFKHRRWKGQITQGSKTVLFTHCNDTRRTAEGKKYFNTSNFCAAATIPGTMDGLSVVWLGQSFTHWKLPDLNLITFHCF